MIIFEWSVLNSLCKIERGFIYREFGEFLKNRNLEYAYKDKFSKINFNAFIVNINSEISGPHGGEYEDECIMCFCAV